MQLASPDAAPGASKSAATWRGDDDVVSSLIARTCRSDGAAALPPSLTEPLAAWMASTAPHDVRVRYEGVLDALRDVALAASPPGVATYARDALWGLTHQGAAAAAGGSGVAPYPDVRLSAYVLPLGPRHVVGQRVPPHGAAAARPPPSGPLPPPRQVQRSVSSSGGASAATVAAATAAASASAIALGTLAHPLPPLLDASSSPTLCPVHTPLAVALTLTNVGRATALVSVRPLQSVVGGLALLAVSPTTLSLKRGESGTLSVHVHLLRPGVCLDALFAVEVAGGHRLCALVRALGSPTVFGVHLSEVPLAHRDAPGAAGHEGIPVPLSLLRERLFAVGGGSALRGLDEEGLFRVAPSIEERENLRAQLDAGTFRGAASACTGIAAAHMVKQFLRELPVPLFAAVPTEVLLAANTEAECIAAVGALAPPARAVLSWLAELLCAAAAHEGSNKMDARSLAICAGPNLFATDETVNPMEALMASQKAVNLLLRIVLARAAGRPLFPPPSLTETKESSVCNHRSIAREAAAALGGGVSSAQTRGGVITRAFTSPT